MENNTPLNESFKKELEAASANTILDPAYRRRKMFFWIFRATVSLVLYILFWKYEWVKWSLFVTIPLASFSLFSIIGTPYLLKKKIERTRKLIEETEKAVRETPGEG